MAKPELGLKRQCQNCGAKFFDLGRNPIICPRCSTPYQVVALPTRASRAAPRDEEEADVESEQAETVSLEDAEATPGKEAVVSTDDVEIDADEDDTAETFLEEEEGEGDDVSDLIDGDIEPDEET